MTSFLHDLPDFDSDEDTQADEPLLVAHNAVPTVVMLTPEGRILGEVMTGGFAHRQLLAAGYYELAAQS
jgi:hypothetical protein